jgi:hypothetical protein
MNPIGHSGRDVQRLHPLLQGWTQWPAAPVLIIGNVSRILLGGSKSADDGRKVLPPIANAGITPVT